MKFDRIWVGAGATLDDRALVVSLLKEGGIAVGPFANARGEQSLDKLTRGVTRLEGEGQTEGEAEGQTEAVTEPADGAALAEAAQAIGALDGSGSAGDEGEGAGSSGSGGSSGGVGSNGQLDSASSHYVSVNVEVLMRVSFAPLVQGGINGWPPQTARLVLSSPIWGEDPPLAFPPSFRRVVALLYWACVCAHDPDRSYAGGKGGDATSTHGGGGGGSSGVVPAGHPATLPWDLWQLHVLPQLPFDAFEAAQPVCDVRSDMADAAIHID